MNLSLVNRRIVALRPERLAGRGSNDPTGRATWFATGCVAAALYGLLLAVLLLGSPPDPVSGAGGQYLQAIDITIVPTRVIETRRTVEIAPDAANAPAAEREADQPEPDIAVKHEQTAKPERVEKTESQGETIAPAKEQERTTEPRKQGGAVSVSIDDGTRAGGVASAAPGAIRLYAAQVRAALARSKPTGRGQRGTAMITFGIDPSGKTTFARITRSSGNLAFDRAAQDVVARASFPPPPAGMTQTQLTYVIPFHFK